MKLMAEKDYEAIVRIRITANNKKEVKEEIKSLIAGKVADFEIDDISAEED